MVKSHSSFPHQDIMTPEAPTVYTKAYGDLRKKNKDPRKEDMPHYREHNMLYRNLLVLI